MKVLIIGKYDIKGGSALAGYSIYKSLRDYTDIDTYLLCGDKIGNDSEVSTIVSKNFRKFEKIFNVLFIESTVAQGYWLLSNLKIFTHPYLKDVDIINLHDIHGNFFSYPLIKKLSKIAPIVITMQGMWYITGGCYFTYDCDNWKTGCKDCSDSRWYKNIVVDRPHFHWKHKKNIYSKSNLTGVTCSKWMQNIIQESPLFENKKVYHIYNPINTDNLKPLDKELSREILNLPKDKNIVCFGAADISDERKGFSLFIESITRDFVVKNDIFLILMGADTSSIISKIPDYLPYKYFGSVDLDIFRSIIYNAADVFIFPTQADNLPNMLIETMSCGVPPITFDVGGCGEVVINDQTGYLAIKNDFNDFNNGIIKLCQDEVLRRRLSENCRTNVIENFSLKVCADKYSQVFREVLNK
ncbi:MAG: glycosyltransferase [Nitrospirae bacterium]|nr:glycosyltransferase [Nitrospirota bacterium]